MASSAECAIRYSVTTTIGAEDGLKDEYIKWLKDGHVQEVVEKGGAVSAEVLDLDVAEGGESKVVSTYVFPSRAAFDNYVAKVAPELRKDGVERFGKRDVSFSRTIGSCVFSHSA